MRKNTRRFSTKAKRSPVVQQKARRRCLVETLESRQLLTATALATGAGTAIEYTGPYDTYLPVGAGSTAYSGYSSYGLVDVPVSAFGLTSGASGINSLSLSLFNTGTSGKYAPAAGEFGVYLVPEDTVPASSMTYQGGSSSDHDPTTTDLSAIGTTSGGASTLGISSSDELGTFNITSGLAAGYSSWTFSGLNATIQSAIESDLNSNQDVRLIVVPEDNTGHADWAGTNASEEPEVQMDINQAPLVNFASNNFTVNEADQTSGHTTTDTITLDRTSNPSTTTVINYTMTDGTAISPADYTNTSGSVTFAPGQTTATIPVVFNDITTTQATGTVTVNISQPGTNSPQAVFPTGGTSATATINYIQSNNVSIDASTYSVNESAGTATIQLDRSGTNLGSTTTVNYATADGVPYVTDPANPDNAQAGRDYTSTSGTATFSPGQTTTDITVPLIDVATFAGTRSFTLSISSPSTGNALGSTTSTTVNVTDNTLAGSQSPTGYATEDAGIETTGPYYTNSYLDLVGKTVGSLGYSTMPEIEFGTGSTVYPTTYGVSSVSSVELGLYNDATTGAYAGVAGSFDVYALLDSTTTTPVSGMTYEGGTGNTGSTVIGTQGTPVYIGTAYFPSNQVGYNNFVFDNLPGSVSSALTADLNDPNSADPIRFALVPTSGSSVAAEFEGSLSANSPQLTLLVQPSAATVETFNVSTTSTTVNKTAGTETITVNRTSTGNVSDTATVQYATSDGINGGVDANFDGAAATAGVNYTATSGTLTFAAGQTSATFTIPITNYAAAGETSFTVSLSSPTTGDPTRLANSTSATEEVTILDPNTTDTWQYASDSSQIESTGLATSKTYFDVQPTGTYEEFSVADFNTPGVLPYSVTGTVGKINQITLGMVAGYPTESWETDGLLNVYLVTNTTTNIDTGTPLVYDSTDDPTSGLGSQLGTSYLLGTIDYDKSIPTDSFTGYQLTNANSTALGMLASALNTGSDFRVVVAPGDSTVAASYEGQFATSGGYVEVPVMSFNFSAPGAAASPPSLTQVGPTNTFTVGGSGVAVDSGMDVSSSDADITGATMLITNFQTGDSLAFTNQNGITGSFNNTTGTLTLSGSATPAQYQTALRSVAFSTTSATTTARTITVQGDDSAASPTTGNTISETVDVSLPAPVVTESDPPVTMTAGGPAVTVDSGVTVTSHDSSINGATVTITNAQTGDSLHFATQNGISGSFNSGTGTLTLTGSSSVANYQTALRSVTFSNATNTSLTTRDISIAASDSNATPHGGSTSTGDTINVVAPLEVTGVYTSGSAWVTGFKSYLGSHSEGSASFGFNVADGSTQLSDLPWINLNTITIVFNEAPSQITESSLEVLSGSGNTVHTITGFSSLGGNAYSWTLGSSLTNAKYVLALASTTSSFGTPVEDAQGAGLDGKFVNSASVAGAAISLSAPSGTGLAGSGALDVFFNVLPGDVNRDGQDNGTDVSVMRPLSSNTRDNSTLYSAFVDVNGDGSINTTDLSDIRPDSGRLATGTPTAPADTQVGGLALDSLSLDSGTALGVIESSSSAPAISNNSSGRNTLGGSVASTPASSSTSSLGSDDAEDDDSAADLTSALATDEAVGTFDLTDLWV